MKLSTIQQILAESSILLSALEFTEINTAQKQSIRFDNLQRYKKGIETLKKIEILDDELSKITSTNIFLSNSNKLIASNLEGKFFIQLSKELFATVSLLLRSLDKIVNNNNQDRESSSIYIKLPNTNNLQELSKDIQTFNNILSNVVLNKTINGEVILESVEAGSVWLKIYVGSTVAVSVIGSLAWSSAVVYKKYQEGKIIEEIVNQKKIENKQKQQYTEASKLLTDLLIEAEAENIYHTYYKNGEINHEQIERIKGSIKMLSEELNKGAEVTPSLMAPEEVSNLFPDMKALPILESKVKKIE